MRAFHQNAGDSFDLAAKYFQRAIELDSSFAAAYARLAITYVWMNPADPQLLTRVGPSVSKALELDPASDHARHAAAVIKRLQGDWRGAEKEVREALRLHPDSVDNLFHYATYLTLFGKTNEAVRQVEKGLRLDSHSFIFLQNAAFVYLAAGQVDKAISQIQELIDREPTSALRLTETFLIPAFRTKGDYLKAIELERQSRLARGEYPPEVEQMYTTLKTAFLLRGTRGYWEKMRDIYQTNKSNPVFLAKIYAHLGDRAMAFRYLNLALAKTPIQLGFDIRREADFDMLRSDPQYDRILKAIGIN
jgi:tetratricopeptide (TPR) repeat protein